MKFIKIQLLLLELYILIKVSSNNEINIFRNLEESHSEQTSCFSLSDCFNCTLNPNCRWIWKNESCIPYENSNKDYSLQILSKDNYNNITTINSHINFIRKICFKPITPYIENNNSIFYNNISLKYCGPHYITTSEDNIKNDFKIEMNKINGFFGIPNLLCEFIILSGPNSFDIRIQINETLANNFYLLYSEDSINIKENINKTKTLSLEIDNKKVNTFIFYCLQALNSSPFVITYNENIETKTSQATGYIMIALIVIILALIIFGIIYIRNHSKIFKKQKFNLSDEDIKINDMLNINDLKNKKINENKYSDKKTITPLSPSVIDKFNPQTPEALFQENKFLYNDICVVDNTFIIDKNDIYKAKCGHLYHIDCFKKLVEEMKNSQEEQELKCVSCHEIIYPV